ncbi:TIGR04219 family outer membrane beta-barrel protein [Alkalimonas delamerensis]|uniref:TIGR04219 family outer membrane beta-barrel protein n=1 Tax=Alkalimonas delamerensis TaxID=265981 RepID=A0ABT9GLC8_9GAMM|nr:TIGR04219 family outer membrane beta-barrel protein [Alkalimonas delamerensis]MDP4527775.1 TIGR04219 family outer membrane beta-barrel protein [Alkalimonas delamerensis]
MKRWTMMAMLPLMFAGTAQADFFAVKLQLDSWQASAEGDFGQTGASQPHDFSSRNQLRLGLAFEHPIPLIPNLAVRYQGLKHQGRTELAQTFALAGQSYAVGSELDSSLDLAHIDAVFYYQLLDNNLVGLNFGAMVKRLDGKAAAQDQNGLASEQRLKGNLAMLHASARLDLVGTSWQLFAEANGVTPGRHQAHDVSAGLVFQFIDAIILDGALRLGYRDSRLELDNLQGVSTSMDYSGVFVGLELSF